MASPNLQSKESKSVKLSCSVNSVDVLGDGGWDDGGLLEVSLVEGRHAVAFRGVGHGGYRVKKDRSEVW